MPKLSFSTIAYKTTVVHTVTYFVVGFLSFLLLDYTAKYADPVVGNVLRQTGDPLVSAGPLFQVLRGFLFGIVFFALRDIAFSRPRGWLTMWLVLVIVGIFSPFGGAPGSIEGMVYTLLPLWFHILSLPEILIQSGLLAFLTCYWVNHPDKKWLGWLLVIACAVVIVLALLGVFSAVGLLPGTS